jgi:uncharacterized protein YcbK (DUF882 family)
MRRLRRTRARRTRFASGLGLAITLASVLPGRVGGTERLPGGILPPAPRPAEPASAPMTEPPAPLEAGWATDLPTLTIENPNSRGVARIKLYAEDGTVDQGAFASFNMLVGGDEKGGHAAPMNRRVVQLLVKAATHFEATHVVIVSAYRPGRRGGPHTHGVAIDFSLGGTSARALAAYLRTLSRVGVGIYTHPKTQYVHLDVRETSWHWIDASPPGRTWHEAPLPDQNRVPRDAAYTPEADLP